MTIVENGSPFDASIRALTPLHRGYLHVLVRAGLTESTPQQVFSTRKILADRTSRLLLEHLAATLLLEVSSLQFVDEPGEGVDVVALFAPLLPRLVNRYPNLVSDFSFFGLEHRLESDQHGLRAGAAAVFPFLSPERVPAFAYGSMNPAPIDTLGLDVLLAARTELDETDVYEITQAIAENKQLLEPRLQRFLRRVGLPFEPANLTMPLHPGARRYHERDKPSTVERYSGLLSAIVPLSIALVSGLFGLARWNARRKKDRIDVYYDKTLALRSAFRKSTLAPSQALDQITALEEQAFRQLIDERLMADESFRIFATLLHNVQDEVLAQSRSEAQTQAIAPPESPTTSP